MDGNFCSLYPYDKKYSTISSVKFTPILKTNSYRDLLIKKKYIKENIIKKNLYEHAQKDFFLSNKIKKMNLILSYKVKLRDDINDLRTSNIIKENKQISILCGKLDAALVVYNEIIKSAINMLKIKDTYIKFLILYLILMMFYKNVPFLVLQKVLLIALPVSLIFSIFIADLIVSLLFLFFCLLFI